MEIGKRGRICSVCEGLVDWLSGDNLLQERVDQLTILKNAFHL